MLTTKSQPSQRMLEEGGRQFHLMKETTVPSLRNEQSQPAASFYFFKKVSDKLNSWETTDCLG